MPCPAVSCRVAQYKQAGKWRQGLLTVVGCSRQETLYIPTGAQAPDPLDAFRRALLAAVGEAGSSEPAAGQLAGGDAAGGAAGGSSGSAPGAAGAGSGGGGNEGTPALRVEWPLFLILAKQPVPLPPAG